MSQTILKKKKTKTLKVHKKPENKWLKFGPKPKLMHENQLISQKSYSVDIGGKKKKTGLLLLDRSPGGLRTSRNTAAVKNANTTKKQKKNPLFPTFYFQT